MEVIERKKPGPIAKKSHAAEIAQLESLRKSIGLGIPKLFEECSRRGLNLSLPGLQKKLALQIGCSDAEFEIINSAMISLKKDLIKILNKN